MPSKPKPGTTKADLIDRVYQRDGELTKSQAAEIVDTIFQTMKTTLGEGRTVRIKNFGTFEVTARAGRRGVNPTNGEEIFIEPHNGLSFRPSRSLKDVVAPLPKGRGRAADAPGLSKRRGDAGAGAKGRGESGARRRDDAGRER